MPPCRDTFNTTPMKTLSQLILLTIISLSSCKKEVIDNRESTFYEYYARKCSYIWADNIRGEIFSIPGGPSGPSFTPLAPKSSVKLKEYYLAFNTCNVDVTDIDIPNYQERFSSDTYDPLNSCPFKHLQGWKNPKDDPRDAQIEAQIAQANRQSGVRTSASSLHHTIMNYIDYRTSTITNLNITCSQPLFGVEAGKSLNDHFLVRKFYEKINFIISSDKRLVTAKITDISLSQYLSYSPLAPSGMILKLKDGASVGTATTVTFTVELEVDGKNTIRSTTKPITLLPS